MKGLKNMKKKIVILSIIGLLIISTITYNKKDDTKFNNIPSIIKIKDSDLDNDGLLNDLEKILGTNSFSKDSDLDGINDYYEIKQVKTNPLVSDTDQDQISDGNELDLGLDPNKKDTLNDGIIDGNRDLSYEIIDDENQIEIKIKGKKNIASTTIDIINKNYNINGILNKMYYFNTLGDLLDVEIKIKYDYEEIIKYGFNEEFLTIYKFNEQNKTLESIYTEKDIENKTLTFKDLDFNKYFIGDSSIVNKNLETEILFVIDNSVSMYSESQLDIYNNKNKGGAVGNDEEFKRFELTKNLISLGSENYLFGIAEFSGNYINLKKFLEEKNINEVIDSMKGNWYSNSRGTNIKEALEKGILEFKDQNKRNYLILMTDGKNTYGQITKNNKNKIIKLAKDKNVKICTIGLGTDINEKDLQEISLETGCNFYHALDDSALKEVYNLVAPSFNFNYYDTTNDGIFDGIIVADSGFLVQKDGFSFENVAIYQTGGLCFGMALFSNLYYQKKLPLQLDSTIKETSYVSYEKSFGYDLNNTYFAKFRPLYNYQFSTKELKDYFYNLNVENIKNIGGKLIENKHLLNINNSKFLENTLIDEQNLINALYRLHILQVQDERISFAEDSDMCFEYLIESLNNKDPLITIINYNHAINSIRLIQDLNDANLFKIEVYDNNYPGIIKYLNIKRNKYSLWQREKTKDKYNYTFSYDIFNDNYYEEIPVILSKPIID
ncbi:MAG: VWA domain-containing protein [Firmicutes bacterium]|nr:VWA domain-containing protein [Bacillota bacterium]